jgi:ATP-dependent DNA ligase
VVAGFRWHKSGGVIGSLLLGLYDPEGTLHHVGVAAAFPMAQRKALVDTLAPYREHARESHPWRDWATAMAADSTGTPRTPGSGRMPGAQSRWNAGKDQSWEPVRPELVVEVRYDHLQGDRFRHATNFVRFRNDREPASCTYAQLEEAAPAHLAQIFGD